MPGQRKTHGDLVAKMREYVAVERPAPTRSVVEDGGTDVALARATAATERGRPLRPHEERQVRRETLEQQRSGATREATRKPSLRDRLERMSEAQRYDALASITPGTREYAYVEGLIESVRFEEAEAEYLAAVGDENASLAEIDTAEESEAWAAEQDAASEEQREALRVRRLEAESAELTEQEQRAAEDVARAISGPVYLDDPEALYGAELEEEGDE